VQGVQRLHLSLIQPGDELLPLRTHDAHIFPAGVAVGSQKAALSKRVRLLRIGVQLCAICRRTNSIMLCQSMNLVGLAARNEIPDRMDKATMSRHSTNPTLAEAVAYCVTEAVGRFTEYITPVAAKIVKRPGPKTSQVISHETVPETLRHQVRQLDEEKSQYDSHM
jgi:hypothetical protein